MTACTFADRQIDHARVVTASARLRQLLPALFLLTLPALLGLTFELDSSTVSYTARDSRETWQGVAPLKAVTLAERKGGLEVTAVLEPGSFDSGNFARDGNARFTVFNTGAFPTATLKGSLSLPAPLTQTTASGKATGMFNGTLTLHGVTHKVAFPLSVSRDGAQGVATGSFAVLLSDYEMNRPNLFGIVVEDKVELNVSLAGTFAP